ncbi:MAG: amidophosphoribosyltransferase [Pseudonocardiales bacterium]|nr:MAG: amidophosphoribosyltransferase [Pseudonocardiales bacterium]
MDDRCRGCPSGRLGEVLRPLLDLLLPVDCGGCGVPGALLCSDCAVLLGAPVRVYPPCCGADAPVYALGAYRGRLRTALLAYKERGRRDLAAPLGAALASALLHLPNLAAPGGSRSLDADCGKRGLDYRSLHPERRGTGVCLVPVPSRGAAAARRGGQHVTLLAQRAAAALACAGVAAAVAPALRVAPGVRDSVGLGVAARQANLAGRVLPRRAGLPAAGTAVVLVDDVVTTGTTAAACVAALLRMGVDVPAIVVLAAAGCHSLS